MQNFVTLFNKNYLIRGLLLYESLKKNVSDFRLYIITFDKYTYDFLTKKNFKEIIPIKLKHFEDKTLLKAKKNRTLTEYFWTCSGSTILYLFKKKNLKDCIYLDADIFFFNNPKAIIKSIKKNETCIITKHNYAKIYDQSKFNGIFCVQFMYFKNSKASKKILNNWRRQCLDWCFNRVEDGKFGDQKYLDEWPNLYKNQVHICKKIGAGLAPWNAINYEIIKKKKLVAIEHKNNSSHKIFFFHFHELKFLNQHLFYLGNYKIPKSTFSLIYRPYINQYYKKILEIKENNFLFDNFGRDNLFVLLIKLIKNIKNFKFRF